MDLGSIILSKTAIIQKDKQHPLCLLGKPLHIVFIKMYRIGANMDVGYDPRIRLRKWEGGVEEVEAKRIPQPSIRRGSL